VLNCNITFGGRRMMTCQISDGTGILTMRFFNFSAAMKNSLATGRGCWPTVKPNAGNTAQR
jgi:ATP-dependent DNA helicase RecG